MFRFVARIPAVDVLGYWVVYQFLNGVASLTDVNMQIGGGVAFDTHAAIAAGEQILRELTTSPKQRQPPSPPLLAAEGLLDAPLLGGERAVE